METVVISGQRIPVVPQRHARLRNFLKGNDVQKVLTGNYGHESYKVLSVLIPALPAAIPEYQWEGFSSEGAWQRWKEGAEDAYVESEDSSPTGAEIVDAFEKALMVNGADRLGKLLNLVQSGATLVGAQQTASSLESPGTNGASVSESTGQSSLT